MSATYLLNGRVIPERTSIEVQALELDLLLGEPFGINLQLKVEIILSKIFVYVTTNEPCPPKPLKNAVSPIIGALVHYAGFQHMLGLSFEIQSYTDLNTRQTCVYGADEAIFETRAGFEKYTFSPKEIGQTQQTNINLAFHPAVRRVTEELSNAIRFPDYTAMYCLIAIETIRNFFCDDFSADAWKEKAWKNMRESLCLSKEFLMYFNTPATEQKHGHNVPQTWEERQKTMQIAWETMHRFTLHLSKADTDSKLNLEIL